MHTIRRERPLPLILLHALPVELEQMVRTVANASASRQELKLVVRVSRRPTRFSRLVPQPVAAAKLLG